MPESAFAKPLILCADEDSHGLRFRRLILEQHGYRVCTASSARSALEIFLRMDVDLVITENMLGRDSGESMAAEIRRLRPNVPVLLLTGSSDQNVANADERLQKAVNRDEFLREVQSLLDSRPRVGGEPLRAESQGSQRVPARAEPATTQSLLAEIVESSDDAIFSKTLDGTITSWNSAAERMFRYSAREIVGRNVSLLLPPDRPNEVHEILLKLQRGERVEHRQTKRMTKDGRIIDVSLSISPIRDNHGRIAGASTISRDVSELRRAERALLHSEKLAVAGRMAATVAHEINNPLEALSNIFYLLKQDEAISGKSREFLKNGEEELKRITQVTRLTLGFHRDRVDSISDVSVPDLIENVLSLYQRKTDSLGIRIRKQYSGSGHVRGNSGELRQVFSNLVVNAIDALAARGDSLTLRVRQRQDSRGVDGIHVLIADNGSGIPKESLRRLFEPFFTTKGDKGTGIGLWVSQEIVAKHGGQIRVKSWCSRSKPGTVFAVFLPCAFPVALTAPQKEGRRQHSNGPRLVRAS